MTHLIRAAIGFLLLLSPVWAWAADSSGKPRVVIPETRFEFEPTVEGKSISHDFIIQNKGDAELVVKNIHTA